ncbi:phenazine-specific anthranilate synthase component I [Marmoricola endophyticus]|uniref:anthranilate synthase n=1 Tax=Marmoricola endophyticus TaxID=2040280 RepID=A0A917BK21_9ACTN|nr:anthranilate synthase family protein [Marmoricola endophyticus]GGF46194.1 phenazine-specific anthranilate synthase component I [Marmoricola endophyticus]
MPEPAPGTSPQAALRAVLERPAWAVVRLRDAATVALVGGTLSQVESLLDIPLEEGRPTDPGAWDRLVAVPYRQVAERGFEAHDDGAPLAVVDIDVQHEVPLEQLLEVLPDVPVELADAGGFETDDEAYAAVVEKIIAEEIGHGEGANLVVGRRYRARIADWGPDTALTVLRRLLEQERGAYWTYAFFTGDRYLIGASPERHVSVAGGDVRMNPISGTFRLPRDLDEAPPERRDAELKRRLLDFLSDEKEIYELFMVVDEELKMMCDLCHDGGQVLGPFLKPMTHLVHTEYLLAGRSHSDPREILRDTMYAATVTGSPVENACRLIKRYESEGRGYYGAALALFGRDADGAHRMDSPIVIRSADVRPDGTLTVTAGATLVRDSDPTYEVAETHAKAGGILSAFGLVPRAGRAAVGVGALVEDDDVRLALAERNQRLSRFWLTDQSDATEHPALAGRSVLVLDGEDDFVNMLCHVFSVLGMRASVVRHDALDPSSPGDVAGAVLGGDHDLVVVGPGPGDPRADDDPKIAVYRQAVDALLGSGRPFLAVCLGHQVLSDRLGLPLAFKDIVFQGTQADVDLFGRTERVGFYNTFAARQPADATSLPEGLELAVNAGTGDVDALRGPHYRGIQFHSESILTEHGFDLLRDLLLELLG